MTAASGLIEAMSNPEKLRTALSEMKEAADALKGEYKKLLDKQEALDAKEAELSDLEREVSELKKSRGWPLRIFAVHSGSGSASALDTASSAISATRGTLGVHAVPFALQVID